MTLFTAEGLLRAWLKHLVTKQDLAIDDLCEIMALTYLRWLRTQGQDSKAWPDDGDETLGWLYQQEKLHSRRAPGSTCLSSLREMANLGQLATNDSKGCGGVMRMAPVGLFCWRLRHQWTMGHAFYFGANFSALTHGHPSGNLPAGVLAILIAALADGVSMPEALELSKNILKIAPEHEETLHALEIAEELAASARPPHEAIAALGEGWVAEEALAISVYCALVAKTFRQGVLLAVNHDGDSDSTGAITGNLLGARLGLKAIPKAWLKPLELREVITAIADDLFDCGNWPTGQPDMSGDEIGRIQALKEKYPV
jgi:ADP-ribosylglycohydrolase